MDEAVQDAVSRQIGKELYAGYFYLAISAHFDRESLLGFSKWMRAQAREELTHAMKLFDFMNHRDATARLEAVPAPPSEFGAPLGLFETALAHEQEVSGLIHELYDLAADPAHAAVVQRMEARLRSMLDPEAVDRMVKARQAAILAENGGREAVLARGDLPFSPPPGVRALWG